MSHKFLCNASLHEALFALDVELARACRQSSCWSCGHRLHVSNYPRKPHGVPVAFRAVVGSRVVGSGRVTCLRQAKPGGEGYGS